MSMLILEDDAGSPKGAVLSPCGQYRYYLWRELPRGHLNHIVFIMLNPSTADADEDDQTVRKCMSFATAWGYRHIGIVNLFALRSTDPKALKTAQDPVGPANDEWIRRISSNAELVVCGWGNHGSMLDRGRKVFETLKAPQCLTVTNEGQPGHPLYLSMTVKPRPLTAKMMSPTPGYEGYVYEVADEEPTPPAPVLPRSGALLLAD